MNERIASAVFDSREEAEGALSELRSAGIPESAISIVGRGDESSDMTAETRGVGSSWTGDASTEGSASDGEAKGDVVKGAAVGAGAGALLGIAALAIPGVGPLVAAGAIASSAIPAAAAIGAGTGLAAGSIAGLLADHGVDAEDSTYFEERIHDGGTFVSVQADDAGIPIEEAREILFSNGGHDASRARMGETA
jgi:hypothetical protein